MYSFFFYDDDGTTETEHGPFLLAYIVNHWNTDDGGPNPLTSSPVHINYLQNCKSSGRNESHNLKCRNCHVLYESGLNRGPRTQPWFQVQKTKTIWYYCRIGRLLPLSWELYRLTGNLPITKCSSSIVSYNTDEEDPPTSFEISR